MRGLRIETLGFMPSTFGYPREEKCLNEIFGKYLWNNMENTGKYSSINWVPKKLKIDKMISHPKVTFSFSKDMLVKGILESIH